MPHSDTPEGELLSVAGAARELGRSARTVLYWIHTGRMAATKLGSGTSAWVITRNEVERLRPEVGRAA